MGRKKLGISELNPELYQKNNPSIPLSGINKQSKAKKNGGYNSCHFFSLAVIMLTNGWHQKSLFGHEYFWPTVSRLIEQKM